MSETMQPQNNQPVAMGPQNNQPVAMDPAALALAKSIRQAESGSATNPSGNFNAAGDYVNGVPTSKGAYQWQAATWKAQAGQILGDPNAVMSSDNQNAVAYGVIKNWKDQGLNPAQIAAKWNSGHEVGWENMIGTNPDTKISYNVPAYVQKVMGYYQNFKTQAPDGSSGNVLAPATAYAADGSQTQTTTPDQGPSVGGFVENVGSSALNLAGGLANAALHPITTVSNLAGSAAGGIEKLFGQNNSDTQKFDNVINYFKGRYGGGSTQEIASNIAKTAYTDPVGAALDISTLFDGVGASLGVAGKVADIGKLGEVTRAADAAKAADFISGSEGVMTGANASDKIITEGMQPNALTSAGNKIGAIADATNPLTPIIGAAKGAAGLAGKVIGTTASKIIGWDPEVIADLVKNHEDYSKAAMSAMDRGGLANEFGNAIDNIEAAKSATGAEYGAIRNSGAVANITPEAIQQVLQDHGLTVTQNNGVWKIGAPTADTTMSTADVAHFQQFLDQFGKSQLDANQFLNARSVLSSYSNYAGKTSDATALARDLRGTFEKAGDEQIPGLKATDEKMAPQINQWKQIKKDFLTRDVQTNDWVLKDGAANKIANALKKPELLKNMEEVLPGISRKIEILKNIESIEKSMGIKVGMYTRSLLEGGAIATGNIPLVIGMVIAHPAVATQILRGFGYASKASVLPILARVRALLGALPEGAVSGTVKAGIEANKSQNSQQPK